MPERFLLYLYRLKASVIALPTTFAAVELTTGQTILAALLAFASAILAAWLAARPGIIRARSSRQLRQDERHIMWLQDRISYHSKVVVLVRKSKHDALNYIDELHAHVHKLRGLLEKDVDVPTFNFKYYDDICGEEDRALSALTFPTELHATISPEAGAREDRD